MKKSSEKKIEFKQHIFTEQGVLIFADMTKWK